MEKIGNFINKKMAKMSGFRLILAVVVLVFGFSYLFDFQLRPSREFLSLVGAVKPSPSPMPEPTAQNLAAIVTSAEGYRVDIKWGDVGKKLVASGAIDLAKFEKTYSNQQYQDMLRYLTDEVDGGITVNKQNAYFWVNTLWALGLVQQSKVLDEGVMGTEYADQKGSFASTGGWTLGSRDAVSLYSSVPIVSLSSEEQETVRQIASGIYRPCCGNPTSFPDCNHGMAILGLIELMVSQGYGEDEIYSAALAFNSYWFETTYVDLAYYFQTKEGLGWDQVDPKRVLSAQFSSAAGYQTIKKEIGDIPGAPKAGASCGA